MNHTLLNSLMTQIKTLSLDEQRSLNGLLVANMRHAQKVLDINKAITFAIGDYAEFDAGNRGHITMLITGFSRDRSRLEGVQVNRGSGRCTRGMQWKANAADCFVVDKATGDAIAAR